MNTDPTVLILAYMTMVASLKARLREIEQQFVDACRGTEGRSAGSLPTVGAEKLQQAHRKTDSSPPPFETEPE